MPFYPRKGKAKARRFRKAKASPLTNVKSLTKMMKAVAFNAQETKRTNRFIDNQNMYHNSTAYYTGLLTTSQGVEDPEGLTQYKLNRIGNQIYAQGIQFKFQFICPPQRPNLNLWCFIFSYPVDMLANINDTTFWTGTDGFGSTMPRPLDKPNKQRQIIVHKRFKMFNNRGANSGVFTDGTTNADRVSNMYKNIYLKLNKKITYQDDFTPIPNRRDYGVALVGYDANNTLSSDIIGFASFISTLYFKDG